MKRDANVAYGLDVTVGQRLDPGVVAESALEERRGWLGAQVGRTPGPRMVAVRVGDQRALDRLPRVDVEPAGRAIDARGCLGQHGCAASVHRDTPSARAIWFRAFTNSTTIGISDTAMIPSATIQKFSLTTGTLPKR